MAASLKSRLPMIAAELRPRVSEAVKWGCERVAEDAAANVPIGPPEIHLAERIHVERRGPAEYAVVAGDEEAFYGHILEFGGVNHSPHPFLIPALEGRKDDFESLVTGVLRGL